MRDQFVGEVTQLMSVSAGVFSDNCCCCFMYIFEYKEFIFIM